VQGKFGAVVVTIARITGRAGNHPYPSCVSPQMVLPGLLTVAGSLIAGVALSPAISEPPTLSIVGPGASDTDP
jgi:hypothetical protein